MCVTQNVKSSSTGTCMCVEQTINNQTDQYSDAYIPLPEHAIFIKLISLDRTVNADLTYS